MEHHQEFTAQVMQAAAAAAAAAVAAEQSGADGAGYYLHSAGVNLGGGEQGEEALDGDGGGGPATGDKPLTSRYRGVCWNKKNRRWQAAINSSGKYIYLGSFVGEEEAAKAFDRAAIRLRGSRAKLNFSYSDYIDEQGNVLDDPRLHSILVKVDNAGSAGKGAGGKGMEDMGDPSGTGAVVGSGMVSGMPGSGAAAASRLAKAAAAALGYAGVDEWGTPRGVLPKQNPKDLRLPHGCVLESMVPGEGDVYGVCYRDTAGSLGSALWDGMMLQDLGIFDTDKDARQACQGAIRVLLQYRHHNSAASMLLQGLPDAGGLAGGSTPGMQHMMGAAGGSSSAGMDHALQLLGGAAGGAAAGGSAGGNGGRVPTYGLLLSGGAEGMPGMASGNGGAEAAADVDPSGGGLPLMQLTAGSGANKTTPSAAATSYVELFSWLSHYQNQKLGTPGGVGGGEEGTGALTGVAGGSISSLAAAAAAAAAAEGGDPSGMGAELMALSAAAGGSGEAEAALAAVTAAAAAASAQMAGGSVQAAHHAGSTGGHHMAFPGGVSTSAGEYTQQPGSALKRPSEDAGGMGGLAGAGGYGAGLEDGTGNKKPRAALNNDFAHVQKLSAVKLQDALKQMFEVPNTAPQQQ